MNITNPQITVAKSIRDLFDVDAEDSSDIKADLSDGHYTRTLRRFLANTTVLVLFCIMVSLSLLAYVYGSMEMELALNLTLIAMSVGGSWGWIQSATRDKTSQSALLNGDSEGSSEVVGTLPQDAGANTPSKRSTYQCSYALGTSSIPGVSVNLFIDQLGNVSAGKYLEGGIHSCPSSAKRIHEEAKLLKNLEHVNIVKVLDLVYTSKYVVLIEELADLGSLRQFIDKVGNLPLTIIQRYTNQLLSAIMHVHDLGVIHRDIKAANVLVFAGQGVKLADFGESCFVTDILQGEPPRLHGSPYWLAPETLISGQQSRCSDIYALGSTIHEMCFGDPPHSSVTADDVPAVLFALRNKAENKESPKFDLNHWGAPLMTACLARSYVNRPTASQLLQLKILHDPIPESDRDQLVTPTGGKSAGVPGFLSFRRTLRTTTSASSYGEYVEVVVSGSTLEVAHFLLSRIKPMPPLPDFFLKQSEYAGNAIQL